MSTIIRIHGPQPPGKNLFTHSQQHSRAVSGSKSPIRRHLFTLFCLTTSTRTPLQPTAQTASPSTILFPAHGTLLWKATLPLNRPSPLRLCAPPPTPTSIYSRPPWLLNTLSHCNLTLTSTQGSGILAIPRHHPPQWSISSQPTTFLMKVPTCFWGTRGYQPSEPVRAQM